MHDRATVEAIRAGMDRYAVLVFRDQPLTNQEQLDFAQRFDGTGPASAGSGLRQSYPEAHNPEPPPDLTWSAL